MSDEQLQGNHASLNIDLSGVAGTWCLAYLCLPEEFREEARRVTALNFMVSAEGALSPDWEAKVPKVLPGFVVIRRKPWCRSQSR